MSALSDKTLEEMRAGAASVAAAAGASGIDPDYFAALTRTQIRAKWLKDLEKEGKLRIDRKIRIHTSDKMSATASITVWIGEEPFSDPVGEITGVWPSEVLTAQIALALQAGVGEQQVDNG